MDEAVTQLLSYKTVILMVAVVIGTFFIRRIVETAFPVVKQAAPETASAQTYTNHWAVWWNQVILYLIPVLLGIGLSFGIKDLVALEGFATKGGIALYGGISGWFSATGYKILRRVVKTRTGIDLPDGSNPAVPEDAKEAEKKEDAPGPLKEEPKPPGAV
jgi:hypothetical protein